METKKSSPPFLQKIKKPVFTATIFLIAFTLIFFLDLKTRARVIKINNDENKVKLLGISEYQGESLFLINEKTTGLELKKKNPYLKEVKVEKKFPETIIFSPIFYTPQAVLETSVGYFVLSEDGRILSKTKDKLSDFTEIKYYQKLNYYSYSSGDYLDLRDIKLAILFSQNLARLNLPVDILDINDRDMLVCNVGEKKIIFTAAKDWQLQVYELNQIVRQFKVKGQDFKSIDLRFEKPVITL